MINGVPLEYKEITCLDFPRGKDVLAKYNDSIAKYGDKAKQTLARFSLGDNELIVGSNPFMAIQLGSLGLTLATPTQLEKAVRQNPDFFRNQYEDVGLVLRSNGDSAYSNNDFLAKDLYKQVSNRLGTTTTAETPARISFKGLSLKEDENSAYGLVFALGDAEVVAVPEFSFANNGKRFSKTDERGVPIFDNQGNRTFYARQDGLSRLCLGSNLDLGSDDENLAYSISYGRVPLVVSSVAGAQNLPNAPSLKNYVQILKQVRTGELPNSALEGLIKDFEGKQ